MPVKPKPDAYHTVTPYLYLKDATAAIDFYKKAFGASERMRIPGPDGTIGHAELQVGDSVIMMADNPDAAPQKLNGTSASLMIYVDDVDNAFKRAVEAGAKELDPVSDKFYGDRMGMLRDPFGHEWALATHIEDVPPEEMGKRAQQAFAQTG